jgi:hypothetical protein
MEPTDKSIPPVKMTKVIPKAMIALMDTWRNKLRKLENSRKLSFMTEIMINNRMRPMRGPNFFTYCRALLRFIVLLWLMS